MFSHAITRDIDELEELSANLNMVVTPILPTASEISELLYIQQSPENRTRKRRNREEKRSVNNRRAD